MKRCKWILALMLAAALVFSVAACSGGKTFTVTFQDGEQIVATQEVKEGNAAAQPDPAPVKAGYTLAGWTLDGRDYALDTPVTANITLTAKWERITVTALQGKGTAESPYTVGDAAELQFLANAVNAGAAAADGNAAYDTARYKMTADIELGDTKISIGTAERPFKGVFDGDGRSITGFTAAETAEIGLFRYISGATVTSVSVEAALEIAASNVKPVYAGILAAYAENSVFTDVAVSGSVRLTSAANCPEVGYLGGVAGYMIATRVSYADASVYLKFDRNDSYAGGIAGFMQGGMIVQSAVTSDNISAKAAGGIVGSASKQASILSCYAAASVAGTSNAGGVAGTLNGAAVYKTLSAGTATAPAAGKTVSAVGGSAVNCFATASAAASGSVYAAETEIAAVSAEALGWSENDWDFSAKAPAPKRGVVLPATVKVTADGKAVDIPYLTAASVDRDKGDRYVTEYTLGAGGDAYPDYLPLDGDVTLVAAKTAYIGAFKSVWCGSKSIYDLTDIRVTAFYTEARQPYFEFTLGDTAYRGSVPAATGTLRLEIKTGDAYTLTDDAYAPQPTSLIGGALLVAFRAADAADPEASPVATVSAVFTDEEYFIDSHAYWAAVIEGKTYRYSTYMVIDYEAGQHICAADVEDVTLSALSASDPFIVSVYNLEDGVYADIYAANAAADADPLFLAMGLPDQTIFGGAENTPVEWVVGDKKLTVTNTVSGDGVVTTISDGTNSAVMAAGYDVGLGNYASFTLGGTDYTAVYASGYAKVYADGEVSYMVGYDDSLFTYYLTDAVNVFRPVFTGAEITGYTFNGKAVTLGDYRADGKRLVFAFTCENETYSIYVENDVVKIEGADAVYTMVAMDPATAEDFDFGLYADRAYYLITDDGMTAFTVGAYDKTTASMPYTANGVEGTAKLVADGDVLGALALSLEYGGTSYRFTPGRANENGDVLYYLGYDREAYAADQSVNVVYAVSDYIMEDVISVGSTWTDGFGLQSAIALDTDGYYKLLVTENGKLLEYPVSGISVYTNAIAITAAVSAAGEYAYTVFAENGYTKSDLQILKTVNGVLDNTNSYGDIVLLNDWLAFANDTFISNDPSWGVYQLYFDKTHGQIASTDLMVYLPVEALKYAGGNMAVWITYNGKMFPILYDGANVAFNGTLYAPAAYALSTGDLYATASAADGYVYTDIAYTFYHDGKAVGFVHPALESDGASTGYPILNADNERIGTLVVDASGQDVVYTVIYDGKTYSSAAAKPGTAYMGNYFNKDGVVSVDINAEDTALQLTVDAVTIPFTDVAYAYADGKSYVLLYTTTNETRALAAKFYFTEAGNLMLSVGGAAFTEYFTVGRLLGEYVTQGGDGSVTMAVTLDAGGTYKLAYGGQTLSFRTQIIGGEFYLGTINAAGTAYVNWFKVALDADGNATLTVYSGTPEALTPENVTLVPAAAAVE